MAPDALKIPFALLPDRRPPWKEFVFSMVTQGGAIVLILWIVSLRPQIMAAPQHDYREMGLVTTPPPVNHQPAPVREFKVPEPVAQMNTPIPENLRLPSPTPKPKVAVEETPAPTVQIAANKPNLPTSAPAIPKRLVQTNVFSTGSSATPTMAAAPRKVQTGGFGDPNGVPAQANNNTGKPANIAQLGSFDLPAGPGYGNGTGGAKGARGVVASTGFGNGVATGDGSGRINTSRGNGVVRQAGFGDADGPAAQTVRPKTTETAARVVPAEIISKPTPAYTDEARKMRVEGEVLLEVVLEASGRVRVLRVVRGLGHGLDESAVHAAEQINFKPALRDGQPSDSTAVLHIIFQLA